MEEKLKEEEDLARGMKVSYVASILILNSPGTLLIIRKHKICFTKIHPIYIYRERVSNPNPVNLEESKKNIT